MLRSLLITNDRAIAELVACAIRQSGEISVEQIHCPAPTHYQLSRSLQTLALDIAFIDAADSEQTRLIADEIRSKSQRTAVVTFSMQASAEGTRAEGNGSAVNDLRWPFSQSILSNAVKRAVREISGGPLSTLSCILPAKGGAGASTIAVNLACHLAHSRGKRVLVAEGDLKSGTIADHLSTRPAAQSMHQSLVSADDCVRWIWPRHVSTKHGVDWMLTRRERALPQPGWSDYRHLLTFACGRYDHTIVDLPSVLDGATVEAAVLSRRIFVVTTPEKLSLHLAHQQIEELESLGIPKTRIQVLVNRVQSGDISTAQIREMLGCEIRGVFPNDYPAVKKSILDGTFVSAGKLARAYDAVAGVLADNLPSSFEDPANSSLFGFMTSLRRSAVRA